MRKLALLAVAFLSFGALSAEAIITDEIKAKIALLEDDDFDVRENATHFLGDKLPEEYCVKLLDMAIASDLPETRARLVLAAKVIFFRTKLPREDEWKYLHGDCGTEFHEFYGGEMVPDPNAQGTRFRREFHGMAVSYDDKDGKLKQGDVVMEVNGKTIGYSSYEGEAETPYEAAKELKKAGEKLKLKIKRQKMVEKDGVLEGTEEWSELEVEVTVGWKETNSLSSWEMDQAYSVYENRWKGFLKDHASGK
jgi:hypothetical protein